MNKNLFLGTEEEQVIESFLKDGYIIFPMDEKGLKTISSIRNDIFEFSKKHLELSSSLTENDFFDHTEKFVSVPQLNDYKLKIMGVTSANLKFHSDIYHSAKKYLDFIVGNEVCMQRSLNLSIQLPKDESALLPLHTDVWSGNSAYEVVLWLPLVDCYKTKSMYVLPLPKSKEVVTSFKTYEKMDAETFYKTLEKDLVFLKVPKGHGVIFSHSLLHGNRPNKEADTRWTYNIRFKSVFSPYGTKDLGETFIPITLRPITRIGFEHKLPLISGQ